MSCCLLLCMYVRPRVSPPGFWSKIVHNFFPPILGHSRGGEAKMEYGHTFIRFFKTLPLMTKLFVEQPLASAGSANYSCCNPSTWKRFCGIANPRQRPVQEFEWSPACVIFPYVYSTLYCTVYITVLPCGAVSFIIVNIGISSCKHRQSLFPACVN